MLEKTRGTYVFTKCMSKYVIKHYPVSNNILNSCI